MIVTAQNQDIHVNTGTRYKSGCKCLPAASYYEALHKYHNSEQSDSFFVVINGFGSIMDVLIFNRVSEEGLYFLQHL